ncbi:MAG: hypothetical protein ACREXX_04945 [Gammaproteobacteria bacterium]
MPGELRLEVLHRLISAGHFLLFGIAYAVRQPLYRTGALALVGVCSLVAWLAALRRYRLVADTPTSLIASAAQGYVELVGRCELHPDSPALGYLSGPPCVWYRCAVSRRTSEGWSSTSRERSTDTFLLRDASGICVVDPDHAEVTGAHRRSWIQGEYRYDLDYLAPGDPLYALGELATLGGPPGPLDRRAEVGALLSEWKRDPASLRERFDIDRDGEVNLAEWAKAREAAEREVDRRHLETGPPAALHLLRAPADGRPYLLSNRDPLALARSFRFWAWLHVIVLTVAVVAMLVLLRDAGGLAH